MFKVNDRNTKTRCEQFSKLTIKTPQGCQWHRSSVFIVNFEHILRLVNAEHEIADWVRNKFIKTGLSQNAICLFQYKRTKH